MTKRKKVQKKRPAIRSNWTFESAFYDRIGQTPREFIDAKLAAGSDVKSTKYLFEITAAAIARQYHCEDGYFNFYYRPKKKGVAKLPRVIQYNKLVRDRIPEIIEKSGKTCKVEILDHECYLRMLDAKLQEELNEYQKSKSLEELADLLEVMGAVVRARGATWDDLTRVRKAKREKHGGFDRRILLKEVVEK